MTTMNDRIESVTSDLSAVASDTKVAFGSLSVAQLNWKPNKKDWSVAQCLEHVINTHSLYFPIFERLSNGEATPTLWERYSPLSGFFGRFLIKGLDPKNPKKMKTTGKAHPSASEIDAGIVDRYVEHQGEMIAALRRFPPDLDATRTILTSPLLSVFTYSLDDYMTILVVHSHRHFDQAKRVMEAVGFPAAEAAALARANKE